jgi:hypothetical protein
MEEIATPFIDHHGRKRGTQSNPPTRKLSDTLQLIRITTTIKTKKVCHLLHAAAVREKDKLVRLAKEETSPKVGGGIFEFSR